MEKTIVELKRLKRSLNRKPKMPGINGAFNFSFLDKRAGKKDAQENQICEHGDGHITPHIDDKARMFDSYIDRMYLRTSLSLEPLVTEANALVVEFNLHRICYMWEGPQMRNSKRLVFVPLEIWQGRTSRR